MSVAAASSAQQTLEFRQVSRLPHACSYPGCVCISRYNEIYVIGSKNSNKCYKYDITTGEYDFLTIPNYPDNFAPAWHTVSYDPISQSIYSCGGDKKHILRYDTRENAWLKLPTTMYEEGIDSGSQPGSMSAAPIVAASAAAPPMLKRAKSVEGGGPFYDIGTSPAAVMLYTKGENEADTTLHSEWHICGGQSIKDVRSGRRHLKFDVTTQKWSEMAMLPIGLYYHKTVSIQHNKVLLLLGGIDTTPKCGRRNEIYSLDLSEKSDKRDWRKTNCVLPYGMNSFGCVVFRDGLIIVLGGLCVTANVATGNKPFRSEEIWFCDIGMHDPKFIKSHIRLPEKMSGFGTVIAPDETLHIFGGQLAEKRSNGHYSIPVSALFAQPSSGRQRLSSFFVNEPKIETPSSNSHRSALKKLKTQLNVQKTEMASLRNENRRLKLQIQMFETEGKTANDDSNDNPFDGQYLFANFLKERCGLSQYLPLFEQNEVDHIGYIPDMSDESSLKDCGVEIKHPIHRKKIVRHFERFKKEVEQYRKFLNENKSPRLDRVEELLEEKNIISWALLSKFVTGIEDLEEVLSHLENDIILDCIYHNLQLYTKKGIIPQPNSATATDNTEGMAPIMIGGNRNDDIQTAQPSVSPMDGMGNASTLMGMDNPSTLMNL